MTKKTKTENKVENLEWNKQETTTVKDSNGNSYTTVGKKGAKLNKYGTVSIPKEKALKVGKGTLEVNGDVIANTTDLEIRIKPPKKAVPKVVCYHTGLNRAEKRHPQTAISKHKVNRLYDVAVQKQVEIAKRRKDKNYGFTPTI